MGIWKLKGVRGNTEQGICPMCSKEEGKVKKKVKLSRYKPWRHMGGEEVQLLLILNIGARWG
jgi:hypothetical protein